MCNILKFTQNRLVELIPYLLIYSQQFFVTTVLYHIALMRNVFCFNPRIAKEGVVSTPSTIVYKFSRIFFEFFWCAFR